MPGPIDYEMWFGLVMNQDRMDERYVYLSGLAITLANGYGEVPRSIIASMCHSEAQADERTFQINADRAQQAGFK